MGHGTRDLKVVFQKFRSLNIEVLALLLGLIVGLWFVSPTNVLPTSVAWLRHGDMEHAQYMWQYFRYSPVVQWPLTSVSDLGDGWGTIFPSTAGIVLLGLPFKLLSPILPEKFQYLGAWTVANFALQGFFSGRVFRCLGLSDWERLLGVIVLVTSPVFVFRMGMTHLDLAAHWVILAAILVYISDQTNRRLAWRILLPPLALLVNIYLFVIVFMISIAGEAKRSLSVEFTNETSRHSLIRVLGISAPSILLWWMIGYSTFLGAARGEGFFRINALAFLNPGYNSTDSFSLLLDNVTSLRLRQFFSEEGEGFAYLGFVGIVGLTALCVYVVMHWSHLNRRKWIPIVGISGLLFLLALSHRIAIVRREVQLPIPEALVELRQVFRVANRFSWLSYYLILLVGWVALCRLTKRFRYGPLILGALVLAGTIDQSHGLVEARSRVVDGPTRFSELTSTEWRSVGESVTRMYLVPTFDVQANEVPEGAERWLKDQRWSDLIGFGAEHRLTTNFAYVGRPVSKQVDQANSYLDKAFASQSLPRKSVLFFASEEQWTTVKRTLRGGDSARHLGDFFIIVTGD